MKKQQPLVSAMSTDELQKKCYKLLNKQFKFNEFRPGQLDAITTLITKNRLLCIQPTGHGKSLLYQLPAMLLEGMTIVISPLLALMRDQTQQLNQRFKINAASLNSDQSDDENYIIMNRANDNKLKILFVAPEKLDNLDYFQFLLALPISLIVIDEAHCISTWGHDFRPSYRQILNFIEAVENKKPELKVLALTATANQQTEQDIQQQLTHNKSMLVQRHSMDRPNIELSVIHTKDEAEKLAQLELLMKKLNGCGLIYCATRENTELVASFLQAKSFNVEAYHAGMNPTRKRQLQQDFIENNYQAIAATNALGMGIDKSDLRYIIHFDIPGSITAYYQEVGRAGRDGKPAKGILLFNEDDKKIQQYFIDAAQPTAKDFNALLKAIQKSVAAPTLSTIKTQSGQHPTRVNVMLAELIDQGFVFKTSYKGRQVYHCKNSTEKPNLLRYERQFEVRTHELQQILNYAKQKDTCLMTLLRNALGDEQAQSCQHCSICKPELQIPMDENVLEQIKNWLNTKISNINLGKMTKAEEGIAILNGSHRTSLFIEFMKNRKHSDHINIELMKLIEKNLKELTYKIQSVVVIPSKTWKARENIATQIAEIVNAPLYLNALDWYEYPEKRQGELLNNDQRYFNVAKKMQFNLSTQLPEGPILLVDDYIGSGATMKEVIRAMRKQANIKDIIIPFTIAQVKWRLGKAGMI